MDAPSFKPAKPAPSQAVVVQKEFNDFKMKEGKLKNALTSVDIHVGRVDTFMNKHARSLYGHKSLEILSNAYMQARNGKTVHNDFNQENLNVSTEAYLHETKRLKNTLNSVVDTLPNSEMKKELTKISFEIKSANERVEQYISDYAESGNNLVRNYKVTSETNTPEINKAIESLRLDPVSADKSELVIKATAELEKTREKNVLALNESQREMNKNLVAMNCIVKNIKTSLPQSSPAVELQGKGMLAHKMEVLHKNLSRINIENPMVQNGKPNADAQRTMKVAKATLAHMEKMNPELMNGVRTVDGKDAMKDLRGQYIALKNYFTENQNQAERFKAERSQLMSARKDLKEIYGNVPPEQEYHFRQAVARTRNDGWGVARMQ